MMTIDVEYEVLVVDFNDPVGTSVWACQVLDKFAGT